MASAALRAKAALLSHLRAMTGADGDLFGTQVSLGPPRDMGRSVIYFGRSRLTWEIAVAEAPQLSQEIGQTDVVIRVVAPDADGTVVEAAAEAVAAIVTGEVGTYPTMAGRDVWMSIGGGVVDQSLTDDERICLITLNLVTRSPV